MKPGIAMLCIPLQAVPGAQCSQTSFEKLLQEILFRMILQ
jgi:hypothetical protein